MARPTLYTSEMLAKAKAYLTDYPEQGDVVPTIAGLAVWLGVTRETCHDWARQEEKEEFSYILKELMAKQEQKLFNGSLRGAYNATITKLMLTKHGYSDKTDQTISGGDKPIEQSITVTFIDSNPDT